MEPTDTVEELCAYYSYLDKLNDMFSPDPHIQYWTPDTILSHHTLFFLKNRKLNSGRNLCRNSNTTFLTMGLDGEGYPPAGRTEEAEDNGDVGMEIEEMTDEFLRNLEKNSGSTSLQKEAARSAGTSGTMAMTATTATETTATTGFAEEGMERWQLRKDSSTSRSTGTSAMTAKGMKKINEER
jgi:hypothetical protein